MVSDPSELGLHEQGEGLVLILVLMEYGLGLVEDWRTKAKGRGS